MIVKGKSFSGGYRFKNFEGAPANRIVVLKVPEEVVIPLQQGFGNEVHATVKKGDIVHAGQVIGIDDGSISTPVCASVNGTVDSIRSLQSIRGQTKAVVIKSDGSTDCQKLDAEGFWEDLSPEAIERRLYLSGVSSLGHSGIPTRYGSSVIGPGEVEHLIIEGIGADLYGTTFMPLLEGNGMQRFIEGIRILKRLMSKSMVHVAFDTSHIRLLKQIQERLSDDEWLRVYPLEAKYPQELDEVIIPTLLNKPYPYGYRAAHIGVIVLNVQSILHVYEAVVDKKPLIERVVALCGPGYTENKYVRVRIGSQVQWITGTLKKVDSVRLIIDSPINGPVLPDESLPVERDFNSIIAIPEKKTGGFFPFASPGFKKDSFSRTFVSTFLNFKKSVDTNLHGEERPCIFCGYCEDVCPVQIIPHLIYRNVDRGKIEEFLIPYGIFRCIECNLCTYVCPSKINVASYIREGKDKLRDMELGESVAILPKFKLKGVVESKGTNT